MPPGPRSDASATVREATSGECRVVACDSEATVPSVRGIIIAQPTATAVIRLAAIATRH